MQAPIVHIHIPKAGGSTLENLLERNFTSKGVFLAYRHNDGPVELFHASEKRRTTRAVSGHFHVGRALACLPQGSRLFTMLRHPFKRAISNYFMYAQHANHPLGIRVQNEGITLGQFMDPAHGFGMDNVQTKYLAGVDPHLPCTPEHLETAKKVLTRALATFGILERFKESVFLFGRRLELRDLTYTHVGKSPGRPGDEELDPADLRAVKFHNLFDMELYSLALETFDARMRRLRAEAGAELDEYLRWEPEVRIAQRRHEYRDGDGALTRAVGA